MLIGTIADDFTGASDIANTLAKGSAGHDGLNVAQFMGVPDEPAPLDVEAGVISLKSRSIPAGDAIAQSLSALKWLLAQGCEQIVYKYCSTFDSTPQGNIGPVSEALAEALNVKGVIACPAFPAAGRTVYKGHLFVHDRLLNESGMQNHPLTPMTDPDIRRWLERQSSAQVGLIPADIVRSGSTAVARALADQASEGRTLVIADALTDDDLLILGKACAGARLVTGGSGIALGLPANFIESGRLSQNRAPFIGKTGPAAILAGSCSGATRQQIAIYAQDNPVMAVNVDDAMHGKVSAADVVAFVERNRGSTPLVYSSGSPEDVAKAQRTHGREAIADRLDSLFGTAAASLVGAGLERLIIAGGETSGAVAQALNLGPLRIGPEIDPGVPALFSQRRELVLAFKSGNFGRPTFFADAAEALKG